MIVEGLQPGTYNYTVYVEDIAGLSNYDSVLVQVSIDVSAPVVIGPTNISFVQWLDVPTVSWQGQDTNPSTYQILLNDNVISSGNWNNGVNISNSIASYE